MTEMGCHFIKDSQSGCLIRGVLKEVREEPWAGERVETRLLEVMLGEFKQEEEGGWSGVGE